MMALEGCLWLHSTATDPIMRKGFEGGFNIISFCGPQFGFSKTNQTPTIIQLLNPREGAFKGRLLPNLEVNQNFQYTKFKKKKKFCNMKYNTDLKKMFFIVIVIQKKIKKKYQ